MFCFQFPATEEEWIGLADEFERKWQFPHCLGAVDGKHIRIVPPAKSGSYYYNYKHTHSIVLMAIVNANYEFNYCDAGTNGRNSDGGVISNTQFYERLSNGTLNLPEPKKVTKSERVLPYVFVGDEAFALRTDFLKPYRRDALTQETRIFNYRLSRARRIVENAFGILSARFQIFHKAINLKLENIDLIVLTCCVLHNFLRKTCPESYTSFESFDRENLETGVVERGDRCDSTIMHDLQIGKRGAIPQNARAVRDQFKLYFNNEGAVG